MSTATARVQPGAEMRIVVTQEQPKSTAHPSSHKLTLAVVAVGAFVFLLKTYGKTLRDDWTPVGIGVKCILLACVVSMLYYPYELFLQGPDAVKKAVR